MDLARAAAIFLLVLGVYLVGYSRTLPPTADEMIDFSLAQSLAKWQTFAIDQVSTVGPNPEEFGTGGHRYSKYGPLQAVLAVPLFWLAQRLPIGAVDTVLLLNHLVTALTAALLFLLVRRLGYRPGVALAIVGLTAFGTPLWVHSKRFFSEPTITLTVVAAVGAAFAAAATGRRSWLTAAGLAFGLAAAAKYVNVVLLLPVPLYLAGTALCGAGGAAAGAVRALGRLAWFAAGAVPLGALLALYDLARFGNPLATGYAHWEGFSTPVWVGLAGFLFSPGKSIFVYTPLFLLLPLLAPSFIRRFPALSGLLGAIIALHLLLYGSWWVWWGAWAWGPRFIVPILPLAALFLAEGLDRLLDGRMPARGLLASAAVLLGLASVGIQLLGVAVDHTVYLVQLLPLNPKPDTLTLYDLRYQPILHQIPLLTRQWLDFAWIARTGPSAVNGPMLASALAGAGAGILGFLAVWYGRGWRVRLPALAAAAAVLAGTIYQDLRLAAETIDPTTAAIVQALAAAPPNAAVLQMIPSAVVPYANWQKRTLPELGWIEEPRPSPIIRARLNAVVARSPELWVLTEAPPKAPSNGIEAMLDRTLVQIGDEPVGRFRLLRYLTDPARVHLRPVEQRFADGITLTGFRVTGGPIAPGRRFDLTLAWRADPAVLARPDYTVFVHLLDARGRLVAQHDDPPASGYAPTSGWRPGQVVYDDHAIAVPADAPAELPQIAVGLYQPASGRRVPLLGPDGRPRGDTVLLDVG